MLSRSYLKHINLYNRIKTGVLWNSTYSKQIKIPQRIHRSPTDILQALSSTVNIDFTAPNYKYHDDPYLIPTSNTKKRVYALSQEAGRKAAHWIRQQHSELFLYTVSDPPLRKLSPHKNADPPIEAFIPTPNYKNDSKVTVEDLQKTITNRFLEDAKLVYSILEAEKPESLTQEIRQQYLEMLCYFNETEPIYEEWIEERWLQLGQSNRDRKGNTWKSMGQAEDVFSKMEKTPEAYCALIQGMAKYLETEKAYQLYEECRQNKVPLNLEVFNQMFSIVGYLKDPYESRWELILQFLNDMKALELYPDVLTLNSILETIKSMNSIPVSRKFCAKIYAELVEKLGIEPSLATWSHIISIYHNNRAPKSDILHRAIDKLKGKKIIARDLKDTTFFVNAMTICRYQLKDINLAHRIHDLLLEGSNYNFIGDSYRESLYYRNYFILSCQLEPLETFIQMYQNYVPNIYIPELAVMEEVLQAIDLNAAEEHYPLIWSNIVSFGYTNKQALIEFLLESMVRNLPSSLPNNKTKKPTQPKTVQTYKDDDYMKEMTLNAALTIGLENHRLKAAGLTYVKPTVEKIFAKIALDVWTKIEEDLALLPSSSFRWTAGMLSDIIELLVKGEQFNEATSVVEKLKSGKGVISVPSSPQSLINYSKLAVKENNMEMAIVALTYLSETGFPEVVNESKDILCQLLNKTPEEIMDMAKIAQTNLVTEWMADQNIRTLFSFYNQEMTVSSKKDNVEKVDKSSSSSSSDSSDSSDEEEVLDDIKTEKK